MKNPKIRQQFIDAMFTVHGRCSTFQIMDVFGVAIACASRDLRQYGKVNDQVVYSYPHGSYLCRFNFGSVPDLLTVSPDVFLQSLSVVFGVPDLSVEANVKPLPRGGSL